MTLRAVRYVLALAKVQIVGPTSHSKETVSRAIEKALEARLADLDESIAKLRDVVRGFEAKYAMSTETFSSRYAERKLEENLDYMEWRACKEILEDLVQEREMLQEVKA